MERLSTVIETLQKIITSCGDMDTNVESLLIEYTGSVLPLLSESEIVSATTGILLRFGVAEEEEG